MLAAGVPDPDWLPRSESGSVVRNYGTYPDPDSYTSIKILVNLSRIFLRKFDVLSPFSPLLKNILLQTDDAALVLPGIQVIYFDYFLVFSL
jgi:hypothetical protein